MDRLEEVDIASKTIKAAEGQARLHLPSVVL
jgi:hypothetical protein